MIQTSAAQRIWPLCQGCSAVEHHRNLVAALATWNATHPATEQKSIHTPPADLMPVRKLYWCKCRYNTPLGIGPLCMDCVDIAADAHINRVLDMILVARFAGEIHARLPNLLLLDHNTYIL